MVSGTTRTPSAAARSSVRSAALSVTTRTVIASTLVSDVDQTTVPPHRAPMSEPPQRQEQRRADRQHDADTGERGRDDREAAAVEHLAGRCVQGELER